MPLFRLDKLLCDTGECSRSKAKELIRAGAVSVNGQTERDAAAKYDPAETVILVNGEPIGDTGHLYIMLHKPTGVLSASKDARKETVLDLMPETWRRRGIFCIGRLDKDTTGLLLLTDDGELAHRVISPKSRTPKLYRARVEGTATEEDVRAFEEGIVLKDGLRCLPAKLLPLAPGEVKVEVFEGKYHQVKRMLASRGLPVTALHRESIGPLTLDSGLKPGEYRLLTEEEVRLLRDAVSAK